MSDIYPADASPDDGFAGPGTEPLDPGAVSEPYPFEPAPEPSWADPGQPEQPSEDDATLVSDGHLIGDPIGDSEHWFQQAANGFCVPSSVAQIVSAFTGTHYADEQAFVELANELGVFTVGPDGVPGIGIDGALTLLEGAGVPAHLEIGSLESLADHMAADHKIILAVDSGEIWGTDPAATEDMAADHALVLTGIDVANGTAILSDPGSPTGNLETVPLETLLDAWADSGNAMVVTDTAPPADGFAPAVETVAADSGVTRSDPVGAARPDGLPSPGDVPAPADAPGVAESALGWIGDHPIVLLPVVLGAGALVRKATERG